MIHVKFSSLFPDFFFFTVIHCRYGHYSKQTTLVHPSGHLNSMIYCLEHDYERCKQLHTMNSALSLPIEQQLSFCSAPHHHSYFSSTISARQWSVAITVLDDLVARFLTFAIMISYSTLLMDMFFKVINCTHTCVNFCSSVAKTKWDINETDVELLTRTLSFSIFLL